MKQYIRIFIVALACAAGMAGAGQAFATERIEATEPAARVAVVPGVGLEFTNLDPQAAEQFEVYSITGKLVKSVTVGSEAVTVQLPSGCYIVRTASWSKKVVVK